MAQLFKSPLSKPLLLVFLSLFFFMGLGHVHLFDWDEINFAESAREMILTGDYMKVQIDFKPFWEKPPMFFWLQVISMKIFGINEFAARFPNALMGLFYLLTLYHIGKRHRDETFGFLWALLFMGSLLPHLYFKSGIIDPVFNYFIFLSVYYLWQAVEKDNQNKAFTLLAGLFSGLSFLTKGPVGLLIVLLVVGSYILLKKLKYFPKPSQIFGFTMGFVGIVSMWLAVELWQNGVDNMLKFIEYQIELFTQPVATHGQPFYYHFVVVFLGCFPISILGLPLLISREKTEDNLRLWMQLLFWVVMLLFSVTTTKIVHYSSMTYLPLSFLAAEFVSDYLKRGKKWPHYIIVLLGFLWVIWGLILWAIPYIINNKTLLLPYIIDPFGRQAYIDGPTISMSAYSAVILWILGGWVFYYFYTKKLIFTGILSFSIALSASLLSVLWFTLPKIEAMTQGVHIEFLKSKQSEDVYLSSYGFKSYATYFYGKVRPERNEQASDIRWLIEGNIDKPAFLVTNKPDTELSQNPSFQLIHSKGGFYIYTRSAIVK